MNISARNMISGKVTAIKVGAVNSEVDLATQGKQTLVAVITNESVTHLGLKVGGEALALIKAPLVIIVNGVPNLKFSTRNILHGKVRTVDLGTVNGDVTVELDGGGEISAIITRRSIQEMGLKTGDEATTLFKASSVILAVRA